MIKTSTLRPNSVPQSAQIKMFLSIVLFSLIMRGVPPFLNHLPNFSAIDATALFCGAYFLKRRTACVTILMSVWLGDILLSKLMMGHWALFYPGFYWQYSCYILIALLGSTLKQNKANWASPFALSIVSAILFFVWSNFGVWATSGFYNHTIEGLGTCYIAAIPFFKNTLMSDVFFTLILFKMGDFLQWAARMIYLLFTPVPQR